MGVGKATRVMMVKLNKIIFSHLNHLFFKLVNSYESININYN